MPGHRRRRRRQYDYEYEYEDEDDDDDDRRTRRSPSSSSIPLSIIKLAWRNITLFRLLTGAFAYDSIMGGGVVTMTVLGSIPIVGKQLVEAYELVNPFLQTVAATAAAAAAAPAGAAAGGAATTAGRGSSGSSGGAAAAAAATAATAAGGAAASAGVTRWIESWVAHLSSRQRSEGKPNDATVIQVYTPPVSPKTMALCLPLFVYVQEAAKPMMKICKMTFSRFQDTAPRNVKKMIKGNTNDNFFLLVAYARALELESKYKRILVMPDHRTSIVSTIEQKIKDNYPNDPSRALRVLKAVSQGTIHTIGDASPF